MNQQTNTSVVGLAGAVALFVVAALHYALPDFMSQVGSAGDVAATTIITALFGHFLPADFMQLGKGDPR